MVRNETDMTEHPDDILRALADPERLRIAGALAAGDAAAATLAETLELPVARVRRHLTRLAAAGVARLQPDRRTYRLDRETLRSAAEQVGPPRDAGIALGAANEDEEAVLRAFFRDGRLNEIPTKTSKRRIVLEQIAIEFDPGVRYDSRGQTRSWEPSSTTTPRSAALSWTKGSSTGKAVSTGGPAGASTCRRARRRRGSVRAEPPGGTFPRRFRPFRSEMMYR